MKFKTKIIYLRSDQVEFLRKQLLVKVKAGDVDSDTFLAFEILHKLKGRNKKIATSTIGD